MAIVTLKEAATLAGMKSRSTLYRWLRDGMLRRYLLGEPGSWRIDTDPPGERPFVEWVHAVVGPQGWRYKTDEPDPDPESEAEPSEPDDDPVSFWREWGRVAGPDEPPLTDDELEENAALITWHMVESAAKPAPGCFRYWLAEIAHQTAEARRDVALGARWDQDRWDAANVRSLLEDLPCDSAVAMLRELLEAGKVPPEQLEQVREALEA